MDKALTSVQEKILAQYYVGQYIYLERQSNSAHGLFVEVEKVRSRSVLVRVMNGQWDAIFYPLTNLLEPIDPPVIWDEVLVTVVSTATPPDPRDYNASIQWYQAEKKRNQNDIK